MHVWNVQLYSEPRRKSMLEWNMLYSFWTRSKWESFCDYWWVYLSNKPRMDPISIEIARLREKLNSINFKMNEANHRIIVVVKLCSSNDQMFDARLFFSMLFDENWQTIYNKLKSHWGWFVDQPPFYLQVYLVAILCVCVIAWKGGWRKAQKRKVVSKYIQYLKIVRSNETLTIWQ